MKKIILGMFAAASLVIAGAAMAADEKVVEMPELAKAHRCNACHAIDVRVVGPAWKSVADKYRGDAAAPALLLTKVSKGGKGVWGTMPMPANDLPGTSQKELADLIKFILAL
ncbi:MAG: c-type cytochrome [Gallionella sp.]